MYSLLSSFYQMDATSCLMQNTTGKKEMNKCYIKDEQAKNTPGLFQIPAVFLQVFWASTAQ